MSEPIDPECFSFEGLDEIERAIEALPDAGYLVLYDRTDRLRDERVAKFDIERTDAATFEAPAPTLGEWLRQTSVRATYGDAVHRFRVRVYAAKGQALFSAQFVCRCDSAIDPIGLLGGEIMGAPGVEPGVARGMAALGDYYARFGQIVIGTVQQLTAVNNAMVVQMGRQSESDRTRFDGVMSKLLDDRVAEADAKATAASETIAEVRRHELAKTAIDQFGTAARAYFMGGVPPELAELGAIVERSPELKAALTDPLVLAALRDPANVKSLAEGVKFAAHSMANQQSKSQ